MGAKIQISTLQIRTLLCQFNFGSEIGLLYYCALVDFYTNGILNNFWRENSNETFFTYLLSGMVLLTPISILFGRLIPNLSVGKSMSVSIKSFLIYVFQSNSCHSSSEIKVIEHIDKRFLAMFYTMQWWKLFSFQYSKWKTYFC